MRKTLQMTLLVAALGASTPTYAQSFANRTIGLGVSVMKVFGNNVTLDFFVPISLELGIYLESGFDLYLRPQFFITRSLCCAELSNGSMGPGIVVGGGGQFGIRYLFLEESVRPYVGLHVAFLALGTAGAATAFPGAGINAGIDFFVADSVSLGIRVPFDMYLQFNVAGAGDVVATFAIGGTANIATYW